MRRRSWESRFEEESRRVRRLYVAEAVGIDTAHLSQ